MNEIYQEINAALLRASDEFIGHPMELDTNRDAADRAMFINGARWMARWITETTMSNARNEIIKQYY